MLRMLGNMGQKGKKKSNQMENVGEYSQHILGGSIMPRNFWPMKQSSRIFCSPGNQYKDDG